MSRDLPLPPNSTIPPHAKQVFSGQIFDVYQWNQQMYDGSTAVFEKLRRDDAVLVIPVTKQGLIVATKQEQPGKEPFLTFAGGRIDPGETVLHAVKRELREETGYVAGRLQLWFKTDSYSKMDWTIYVYIAHSCEKKYEQELDAGEKITLKLQTFDQFIEMASDEKLRDEEVALRVLRAQVDSQKMKHLKQLFS